MVYILVIMFATQIQYFQSVSFNTFCKLDRGEI